MAYETPLTISDVISNISSNSYVLPSIQREFVWGVDQIECLFDSLMQGYPIGGFLFWELSSSQYKKYEFYSFLQHYHEKTSTHNPRITLSKNQSIMAVLDGQQRLTSLFIGLCGTYAYKLPYKKKKSDSSFPKRELYLNIIEPLDGVDNKYDFNFLTDEEIVNDKKHYWFKVGDVLGFERESSVFQFITKNIHRGEFDYSDKQEDFAMDTLSRLYYAVCVNPTISYYRIKSDELDKVLNIFIRVNSGGTILSYSDLLLSIATAQWEDVNAREEINEIVDEVNSIGGGFNINKDFVLKTALVLADIKDIAFKVDNFKKSNMQKIEREWETIKSAIYQSYVLVSSFGFSRENLRSNNAIIPIAYYLKMLGLPKNFESSKAYVSNRKIIKKWLIMALLKQTFSGQPDNVLRPIRTILQNNGNNDFPIDEIIEKLRGTRKSMLFTEDDFDHLLDLQYGKAETYTALMMIYPSLDFNNKFHMDHIYPKSKFKKRILIKKRVKEQDVSWYLDHVNDISNLQLIEAMPNIQKQNTDFKKWYDEEYPTEKDKIQYRKINYIPDMEYDYSDFKEFIEKRRTLLKKAFEKVLS